MQRPVQADLQSHDNIGVVQKVSYIKHELNNFAIFFKLYFIVANLCFLISKSFYLSVLLNVKSVTVFKPAKHWLEHGLPIFWNHSSGVENILSATLNGKILKNVQCYHP